MVSWLLGLCKARKVAEGSAHLAKNHREMERAREQRAGNQIQSSVSYPSDPLPLSGPHLLFPSPTNNAIKV